MFYDVWTHEKKKIIICAGFCKKVGALEAIFLSCLSVPLPKMGKEKKNRIFQEEKLNIP